MFIIRHNRKMADYQLYLCMKMITHTENIYQNKRIEAIVMNYSTFIDIFRRLKNLFLLYKQKFDPFFSQVTDSFYYII